MMPDSFRSWQIPVLCGVVVLVGACSLVEPVDYEKLLRERQPQLEALALRWASQPARDVVFFPFSNRTVRWDGAFIDRQENTFEVILSGPAGGSHRVPTLDHAVQLVGATEGNLRQWKEELGANGLVGLVNVEAGVVQLIARSVLNEGLVYILPDHDRALRRYLSDLPDDEVSYRFTAIKHLNGRWFVYLN